MEFIFERRSSSLGGVTSGVFPHLSPSLFYLVSSRLVSSRLVSSRRASRLVLLSSSSPDFYYSILSLCLATEMVLSKPAILLRDVDVRGILDVPVVPRSEIPLNRAGHRCNVFGDFHGVAPFSRRSQRRRRRRRRRRDHRFQYIHALGFPCG